MCSGVRIANWIEYVYNPTVIAPHSYIATSQRTRLPAEPGLRLLAVETRSISDRVKGGVMGDYRSSLRVSMIREEKSIIMQLLTTEILLLCHSVAEWLCRLVQD